MELEREARAPRGIVGCLTAGFELVSRYVWLIALPVLLDLLLWLGPHLSIAPLLTEFVTFVRAQPYDPQVESQVIQTLSMLEDVGSQFNLLSLLSTVPLVNLPSLLGWHATLAPSPLGEQPVVAIDNVLGLLGWSTLLIGLGLVLGIAYLTSLAQRVRQTETADRDPASETATLAVRLARTLIFLMALLAIALVLAPIWLVLVGAAAMIAIPLGMLAWFISSGLVIYVALHLVFVIHSLLLGGRGFGQAFWESFLLIRTNFLPAIGLLILISVINNGLGFVWSLPANDSWTLLIGIMGNGCVATALTASTFIFYQERVSLLPSIRQLLKRTSA